MKAVRSTLALAIAALFVSYGVQAQTAASSPARADVKKEAAAANKAGKIEHGEADHMNKEDKGKSVKSREEVKKEAATANKAGKIEHGEADHMNPEDKGKSVKPRAEVKKEAVEATKAGKTAKGEASPAPK